jgi:glutaredoxin
MSMIIIWGKPQCPHCESAKRMLDSREIAYEYKQLGVDFEREDVLAEFTGYNGTGMTL